jgi:hypothetical protein
MSACCVIRDAKGGRAEEREKQAGNQKAHMQGADPATQTTQSTAEAKRAALEQKATETKKSNNHTQQKPEQTRPPRPPAQTPNANSGQRHKTAKQAGEKKGRHAQTRHGGAGQTPAPEPARLRQQGSIRSTSEEGGRATGRRNE